MEQQPELQRLMKQAQIRAIKVIEALTGDSVTVDGSMTLTEGRKVIKIGLYFGCESQGL